MTREVLTFALSELPADFNAQQKKIGQFFRVVVREDGIRVVHYNIPQREYVDEGSVDAWYTFNVDTGQWVTQNCTWSPQQLPLQDINFARELLGEEKLTNLPEKLSGPVGGH